MREIIFWKSYFSKKPILKAYIWLWLSELPKICALIFRNFPCPQKSLATFLLRYIVHMWYCVSRLLLIFYEKICARQTVFYGIQIFYTYIFPKISLTIKSCLFNDFSFFFQKSSHFFICSIANSFSVFRLLSCPIDINSCWLTLCWEIWRAGVNHFCEYIYSDYVIWEWIVFLVLLLLY